MRDLFYSEVRNALQLLQKEKNGGKPDEKTVSHLENVIDDILFMSDLSRKEGLLALEEHAQKKEKDGLEGYMRQLLMLVVDGTDPERVEEIGLLRYYSGGFAETDALACLLCLCGVLAVQSGEHPLVLEEKLIAMLPAEAAAHISDARAKKKALRFHADISETDKEHIAAFCQCDSDLSSSDDGYFIIKLAEYTIESMSDVALQIMMRYMECRDMETLMLGCNSRARKRIFDNLSNGLAVLMIDSLQQIRTVQVNHITRCALSWMEHVLRLSYQGILDCPEWKYLKPFYHYLKEERMQVSEEQKYNRRTQLWELMHEYDKKENKYITGRAGKSPDPV